MIATARILFPDAMVRLSAGRLQMTEQDQALCFLAGANSIFAGEKLLTTANPEHDADRRLFDRLGLKPRPATPPRTPANHPLSLPLPPLLLRRKPSPLSPVVITGLGLSSAFGDRESTWTAVRSGRSAARWLSLDPPLAACVHPSHATLFPRSPPPRRPGGPPHRRPHPSPKKSPTSRPHPRRNRRRLQQGRRPHPFATSSRRLSPTHWPLTWPGGAASALSSQFGFQGPSLGPVAACASGVVAVLQAAQLIQQGLCDVVLAGAADSAVEPLVLAALKQMRVLARVEPGSNPVNAVRPFDRRRSGFLPGEGAALLVLESADHAHARGIVPCLTLSGGAFGSDAYHLTDLDPDPTHLAGLIARALTDAQIDPSAIDLIHPHGTATPHNDRLEALALRQVFGPHLEHMAACASKPQIGHLLGASGAAELVLSCLALRDGIVPPTLNRDDPDPEIDLPFVSGSAQPRPLHSALKLAIGFGGHLAAVVVRRLSPAREASQCSATE